MTESEIRAAAAEVWAHRATTEREASARFALLARKLADVGAQSAVVVLAARAADDEVRHAALCRDAARHFGGDAPGDAPAAVAEIAPAQLSARERVLYETTAFCCVTESCNAALLTATLDRVRDPAVERTCREVLRDEVNHARIGWAHLAGERFRGRCDFLGSLMPRILSGSVSEEIDRPRDPSPDAEALAAVGLLARTERIDLFRATLRDVVFPGLEANGVSADAGRAWVREVLDGPVRDHRP